MIIKFTFSLFAIFFFIFSFGELVQHNISYVFRVAYTTYKPLYVMARDIFSRVCHGEQTACHLVYWATFPVTGDSRG